ncbi:MAG TPA: TMEM175 family protein [Frankiaceae bacterium]|nr:TMEM175 family protein [Frankiaceae bacterium]
MADPEAFGVSDTPESQRLIVFSDGVVAIAITLLALDLPVPEGHSASELWDSFSRNGRYFLAFFISFAVIAAMWNAHHQVFRFIDRSDSAMRVLNLAWLMTIVLIPFATRLLSVSKEGTTRSGHVMLFSLYAIVQMIASLLFLAMVHHADRRRLFASDTPARLRARIDRQTIGMLVGFGLSIPLLLVTNYAWLVWIIGPPLTARALRRFINS